MCACGGEGGKGSKGEGLERSFGLNGPEHPFSERQTKKTVPT